MYVYMYEYENKFDRHVFLGLGDLGMETRLSRGHDETDKGREEGERGYGTAVVCTCWRTFPAMNGLRVGPRNDSVVREH